MTSCIREPAAGGEANERISIVDDDAIYRSLMQHAAGRTRGLECVGSYSGGVEALNRVWESPDRLPTLQELDDPPAWIRRTQVRLITN